MTSTKKLFLYGGVFLLFLVDYALKFYFRANPNVSFPIIDSVLTLHLFINSLLAFSIPYAWSKILTLGTIFIVGGLLVVAYKDFKHTRKQLFPLYLIILGAFSNLIDRIFLGSVTDYIYLVPISYFNIADLLIFAGVFFILFPRRFYL